MNEGDAFARIISSLHEATFDPNLWPTASALIDEVLGTKGNALLIAASVERESPMLFAAGYYRGERRPELEREYLEDYHPWDERVDRLRRLPDSKLVHITQLYSEQQLKTSRSYNEFSGRSNGQNSLNVRMDGPDGSNITWAILNPVKGGAWQSAKTRMIRNLLPHIRQFVRVRQALAGANGLGGVPRRVAREYPDWRHPPRPAGQDHRGKRTCPRPPAARRRAVRSRRLFGRLATGRQFQVAKAPGTGAAPYR